MRDSVSLHLRRRRSSIAIAAIPTALVIGAALVVVPAFGGDGHSDHPVLTGDSRPAAPAPVVPGAPDHAGMAVAGQAASPAPSAAPIADAHPGVVAPPLGGDPQAINPISGIASGLSHAFGSSGITDYLKDNNVPKRTPLKTEHPQIPGLPAGVSVVRQEWLSAHRIALFIKSAAMPQKLQQVQILLARDWYSHPTEKFPEVWALDGLRAIDEESGWTLHTNIEQFYADKNVNVILPVGGTASFYTDWERPDNGVFYKWETFLLKELPPILMNGYRSNGERVIAGLSMGGTAAMNLAEHRPDLFKAVASFSGYLDTTSTGMYTAIDQALGEEHLHAINMWGPEGSQRWIDNDPKLGVAALKGKTVYVSAGNGRDDFGQPGSVATAPANEAGKGLEVLSRLTTQTFIDRAEKVPGINLIQRLRPSGVHAWPYWQFEMTQAWPYFADALGLSKADRGSDCTVIGAIGAAATAGSWGPCVNNEYDVPGGRAQDFRSGQAFWSPASGAHILIGRIGARYNEIGATASHLGFPLTNELPTPDGRGRFVHFQHGSIYWTAQTKAWEIPEDMLKVWGSIGYEKSDLGYPVAEPRELNGSWIQQFQGGYIVRTPDNKVFWSKGLIAKKWGEMSATASELGAPTSNEIPLRGGAFQMFQHGKIYWTPVTGAHFMLDGAIFDHWCSTGCEHGPFGWPTGDIKVIPAGGLEQQFEHGVIRQINGAIVEQRY